MPLDLKGTSFFWTTTLRTPPVYRWTLLKDSRHIDGATSQRKPEMRLSSLFLDHFYCEVCRVRVRGPVCTDLGHHFKEAEVYDNTRAELVGRHHHLLYPRCHIHRE